MSLIIGASAVGFQRYLKGIDKPLDSYVSDMVKLNQAKNEKSGFLAL